MDNYLKKLRDDHQNFTKGELKDKVPASPFTFFDKWYKEAFEHANQPNAMTLSTVDEEGRPSSRIVYLKELSKEGFIFFTNYNSQKGKDLLHNPNVACLFFWESLERQVRIEGTVQKVSAKESDDYFNSRPRSSQLGAWASQQSEVLTSRKVLEDRLHEFNSKYTKDVPRPEYWGGYVIQARKIEFWQGRASRLHDRIVYELIDGKWKTYRTNP
jgi:pyridoxamine 5'-phosphate oxidase